MAITGRVLDRKGRPVFGAVAAVVARPLTDGRGSRISTNGPRAIGHGRTDERGIFQVHLPRTSSAETYQLDLVAGASEHGTSWLVIDPDADEPRLEIRLRPEQILKGRLLDATGQPAGGVRLWTRRMEPAVKGESTSPNFWGPAKAPGGLAWPAPVITGVDGRFTLRGTARGTVALLQVDDARIDRQILSVGPASGPDVAETTFTLQPVKVISGQVTYAGTNRPVPRAPLTVSAWRNWPNGSGSVADFQADAAGRFEIRQSWGNHFFVAAFAPPGEPYLNTEQHLEWPKGAAEQTVNLSLPRGVLIRGKVLESVTGEPISGASVVYYPIRRKGLPENLVSRGDSSVPSGADGSFSIAVPHGDGHILVFGPTRDYVLKWIGSRELWEGKSGGDRSYAHGILPYRFKENAAPAEDVVVQLRRGVTVTGTVVGPEGQTVNDAEIITLLSVHPLQMAWRGVFTLPVRNGRFVLHGLDPETPVRLDFHDARHGWGKHLELSGNQAGKGPLTVRLEPCGKARARFVGPDGSPYVNRFPHLEILATAGPNASSLAKADLQQLAADAAYIPNVDRVNYGKGPFTDAEGRITLPCLSPGALYRLSDPSPMGTGKGIQTRKDFTVKPGETLELGEILIENPSR